MQSAFWIDNTTRLVLPDTRWSREVLGKLLFMGHEVRKAEQPAYEVERDRSKDETDRAVDLLRSTGLV